VALLLELWGAVRGGTQTAAAEWPFPDSDSHPKRNAIYSCSASQTNVGTGYSFDRREY